MEQSRKVEIIRLDPQGGSSREEEVVRENPLTVMVNGQEIATLLCTPDKLEFLALGFLESEGLLQKYSQVKEVTIGRNGAYADIELDTDFKISAEFFQKRLIGSGCGKSLSFYNRQDITDCKPVDSGLRVSYEQILKLMKEFQERSLLFKATGGVHSASLCTPAEILSFAEDIGRHNAVDKILGECLTQGIGVEDKILLSSGRISSEIIIKTVRRRIPVLISRSAPTELSIGLAAQMNISLVGFARSRRMNIYCGEERITS